jgi:hypothetical protein
VPALEFTMSSVDLPELGVSRDGQPVNSVVLLERKRVGGPVGTLEPDPSENTLRLSALMCEVFATGHGGTKAEAKSVALDRKLMSKAGFYRAWNDLLTRRHVGKVQGTNSWRYIPMEQRRLVIEAVGGDSDNPGAFFAPDAGSEVSREVDLL